MASILRSSVRFSCNLPDNLGEEDQIASAERFKCSAELGCKGDNGRLRYQPVQKTLLDTRVRGHVFSSWQRPLSDVNLDQILILNGELVGGCDDLVVVEYIRHHTLL